MYINGVNGYKSAYGKEALQTKRQYNQALKNERNADSFNTKYKKKKTDNSALCTIALAAAALFVGYKGKNQIQKAMGKCGKAVEETATKFAKKCPNLAQAGSSLKEACKTPVKNVGNFFSKIFKNVKIKK